MNMYKKRFKTYFCTFSNYFIIVLLFIFSVFTLNNHNKIDNWSVIIISLAIPLLLFQITQLYIRRVTFTDFRLWFILLLYIFMFGRVFLHAFNLDSEIFWDLMSRYPDDLLYKTSIYILLFIQAIFTGLMVVGGGRNPGNKNIEKVVILKERINKLLLNAGIILLLFSLPFRLYIDVNNIIHAQNSSSYSAIQQHVGLADDFALLIVPSILLLIAGLPKSRKTGLILLISAVIYFVLVMILTGDRRYPVTGILSISLCYASIHKIKLTLHKTLHIVIITGVLLNLLAIIRSIRSENLTSVFGFFSTYGKELFSLNILYETLAEFGLSFFSVVAIIKHIPESVSYLFGLTFIGSFTSLVPAGFLFEGFHSLISPSSNTVNKLEGYPVGATLAGDMFANFGWFSVIFAILFGFLLSKLFIIKSDEKENYYIVRYYSLFYILINLVRSSFFEVFRASFMVYFIPIFIIMILKYRDSYNQKITLQSNHKNLFNDK